MEILNQVLYFIIIIGVLVLVHELGHFLAAKLFRMRVERFSIGFPPRAFGRKIGDTDYCVSWLPIGGYVKIAGMIDESLDTEHLNRAPDPWEFRAKPIPQRIVVITAGVIMNILLAIGIFWGLNITRGKVFHATTTVGFVQSKSLAEKLGLQAGDRILAINRDSVRYWEDIDRLIYYRNVERPLSVNAERDGASVTLKVNPDVARGLANQKFGIVPRGSRALISGVEPGMPAAKAGLEGGDTFVSINGTQIGTSEDVIHIISSHANREVHVVTMRGGKEVSTDVVPNENGMIGIGIVNTVPGPTVASNYGVFEALTVGVSDLTSITVLTLQNIWHIITGRASFRQSIGGPVKIAEMAAQRAELGLESFLSLMAILSISLAIINIFPFPALDGGHLVFLVYEAIFKREIPSKVRIVLQQVGMVLLLALMAFAVYNDIFH
jgi:regulator of sigma E protease